jgi:hypothetical protein
VCTRRRIREVDRAQDMCALDHRRRRCARRPECLERMCGQVSTPWQSNWCAECSSRLAAIVVGGWPAEASEIFTQPLNISRSSSTVRGGPFLTG